MNDFFRGYRLEVFVETDDYAHFRLTPPDGRYAQSVDLVFAADRIGITGDLCPGGSYGNAGVWSALGYHVDWFRGATSPAYLAEKFPTVLVKQRQLLQAIQGAFAHLYPSRVPKPQGGK